MGSRRSPAGRLRGIYVCVVALIAALALAVAPAYANAASPVLEFATPSHSFPVPFEAEGGAVTAELAGFETVVSCAKSHGDGVITGPRSTVSNYVFQECETQSGAQTCKSDGAGEGEITADLIEGDLVYIDQAKHEVGILLNPREGPYMNFKCGGEAVEASGRFLSPVGPINKEATSFTATLSSEDAMQTPSEYEGVDGEKLQAIPTGERENGQMGTTGVDLSFAIQTSESLAIKAVSKEEVEAKQREEEDAAAAAKKRQDDEAAAKKRQEDEVAAAAAAKKRLEEQQAKSDRLKRRHLLSKGLTGCRKAQSKHKRTRCEKRIKKKYGGSAVRND